MATNDLTFNQIATLLTSINNQATGKAALTPTNTSEFVTVGQTALKAGYDPLNTAISQVLGRTIFSVRPYTAKFKGLRFSEQRFGNITRKLNIVDKDPKDDARFNLVDGSAVSPSMYAVNKPEILQTNFYGANVFSRWYTVYKDQLDCAFKSPDEFARFISMITSNISDLIEQDHENLARATIANLIGGISAENNSDRVVHLLTEYNAATGLKLTATTVYQPDNFKAFIQWAYARIAAVSALMTERTQKFQTIVTDKPVTRHTPESMQRVYFTAQNRYQVEMMALADTFHDNYLKMADVESVNFWQSVGLPDKINVTPSYLQADGTIKTPESPVTVDKIFALIMDEEAAGYTVVNTWSIATPIEASGGYSNYWYHFTDRYVNDFTEKAVLFLLD